MKELVVTSHVSRDLLQSAQLFKTVPNVVWEYVSNALQYVDPEMRPRVEVTVGPNAIRVADNGRGMRRADLARFFTMHGENLDRRQGRPGRGQFGTGKSAAFAIASELRIITVQDGRRSSVRLTRAALEAASDGQPVPVEQLEDEIAFRAPNGTDVVVEGISRGIRVVVGDVQQGLERHLRHWRGADVFLNGERIEPRVPLFNLEREIIAGQAEAPWLRGCKLYLRDARAPLPLEDQGVAILANGVLHETTLASAERKEFANYIFGEIDIPALIEPVDGVVAYDSSRSGQLNRSSPVVVAVMAFVGRHVEVLRRELHEADKARRRDAQMRALQRHGQDIADVLNADFADVSRRLQPAKDNPGAATNARAPKLAAEGEGTTVAGGETPATAEQTILTPTSGATGGGGGTPTLDPEQKEKTRAATETPDGPDTSREAKRRTSAQAGGFSVRFEHHGREANRSVYVAEQRSILINLDHPQLESARGERALDDPEFKRLSLEVAFTEYAMAVAQESATAGFFQDLFEPLQEARERIDRVTRRAANLFRLV